jgi:hypothetical protein
LLCWDRCGDPELLAATQTKNDSHQGGGEGEPDCDAIDRTNAADVSAALITGGCACSGIGFGGLVGAYSRDCAGPRSGNSSRSTRANNGIPGGTVAGSILVAARTNAAA